MRTGTEAKQKRVTSGHSQSEPSHLGAAPATLLSAYYALHVSPQCAGGVSGDVSLVIFRNDIIASPGMSVSDSA